MLLIIYLFFFFNDTATTEIYTLSLHDALPIYEDHQRVEREPEADRVADLAQPRAPGGEPEDRKSTRLNSSHANISYAVFCLKKKKERSQPLAYNQLCVYTSSKPRD